MSDRPFDNLFLSAGAMKAGTTWLYVVLSRHPDLFFTREKEIHYFAHRYVEGENPLNDDGRIRRARAYLNGIDTQKQLPVVVGNLVRFTSQYLKGPIDDAWYKSLFMFQRNETWSCDFSNLYCHLEADGWNHVHEMARNLRVMYTMRDPVKRLWSHVKFHLKVTGQSHLLERWGPEDYRGFARQGFVWKNAEYGQALRRLRTSLSERELKVVFYEQIREDQLGLLAEIEDFLGTTRFDYPNAVLNKRVNEGPRQPMPEYFPELFAQDFQRITQEVEALGYTTPSSWTRY